MAPRMTPNTKPPPPPATRPSMALLKTESVTHSICRASGSRGGKGGFQTS